jgi:hypothetical protein
MTGSTTPTTRPKITDAEYDDAVSEDEVREFDARVRRLPEIKDVPDSDMS